MTENISEGQTVMAKDCGAICF